MLRRFADAQLRRMVSESTDLMRKSNALLQQKTAEARTNYDLAQRWKSIAQQAQAELTHVRANRDQIAASLDAVWDALGLHTAWDGNAVDAIRDLRSHLAHADEVIASLRAAIDEADE